MTRYGLLAMVAFIVLMPTRPAAQSVPGSLETLPTRVAVNDHLLVTLVDGSTREGRFDGVSPRGLSILGAPRGPSDESSAEAIMNLRMSPLTQN